MREVAVIGEGLCRFGFFHDRSLQEMGEEAIWNALKDANLPPKAIETAYCGIVGWIVLLVSASTGNSCWMK